LFSRMMMKSGTVSKFDLPRMSLFLAKAMLILYLFRSKLFSEEDEDMDDEME
jgi:hypothetical protein